MKLEKKFWKDQYLKKEAPEYFKNISIISVIKNKFHSLRQLRLILWKNFRIRKRQWILTLMEIVIPLCLFASFAYGRSKIQGIKKVEIKEPIYANKSDMESIFLNSPIEELWFAPVTDFTEDIIKRVQIKLKLELSAIKDFNSEAELVQNYAHHQKKIIAALYFRVQNSTSLDYDISIYKKYITWQTNQLFISEDYTPSSLSASSQYYYSGFAAIQLAVETSFIESLLEKNDDNNQVALSLQEFPYPPQIVDSGLNKLFKNYLPLITIFSFIFLCLTTIEHVGKEKMSGLREIMKIYNMESWMIWLGWLCYALVIPVISIFFIVLLMKVPLFGVSYSPIEYSNGVILYLFLFLYCLATVTFCFFFTTIFKDPPNLMPIEILIWIFSYFVPKGIVDSYEISYFWKILLSFFPNMALHFGFTAMSPYEVRGIGIHCNNVFHSGNDEGNDVTLGVVIIILLFDSIIFMLLTLYIERINPGEYGIPKSFFHIPCSCWKREKEAAVQHDEETMNLNETTNQENNNNYIEISDLTKVYGFHNVLNNINITIKKNSTTILLGENGAGKTTLINIIAGMVDKTSGDILVDGIPYEKHFNKFRKSISFCPQINILFSYLTVKEHLLFCSDVCDEKQNHEKSSDDYINEILERLYLDSDKDRLIADLSDGGRRKVCLAMALIKKTQFLILDEPTSGMDLESRQKIWQLLKNLEQPRTLLISTHSLEEANFLGDWIFVIENGERKFDMMSLESLKDEHRQYNLSLMVDEYEEYEPLKEFIVSQIKGANLLRKNGKNLIFSLPLNIDYTNFFKELQKKQEEYKIINMDFRPSTLTDAYFSKLYNYEYENHEEKHDSAVPQHIFKNLNQMKRPTKPQSYLVYLRHIMVTLLLKRWYFFKKKFYYYIPGIIISTLTLLLSMWLSRGTISYFKYDGTKLDLRLNMYDTYYDKTDVLYGGYENSSSLLFKLQKGFDQLVVNYNGLPKFVHNVSEELLHRGEDNIEYFKKHLVVGTEFGYIENQSKILINSMYSRYAVHGLPISINLATNAIIKSLFNEKYFISVANKPFKTAYTDFSTSELSYVDVGILWLTLIPLGILFLMCSFIIFPNFELTAHFFQIQVMAGVKPIYYWFSNILYDWIICLLRLTLLLTVVFCVNGLIYESKIFTLSEIRVLILIFVCHTFTVLPYTYLFSYVENIPGGITLFIMFGIFFGIVPTVAIRAMEMSGENGYITTANILKYIFIFIFPHFTLTYSYVKFSQKYVENHNWDYMDPNKKEYICESNGNPCCNDHSLQCHDYKNYFYDENLGIQKELGEMWISFFVNFCILLLLPKSFNSSKKNYVQDVFEHCNKFIVNIFKTNKGTASLGLVGRNSSGKSTVFEMLVDGRNQYTNHIPKIKKTESYLQSIKNLGPEYVEQIGYCPQQEYLNPVLTGKQLLKVLARMKGYSSEDSEKVTEHMLDLFDLNHYQNKQIKSYTRGNKRKLSCAMACLGFPRVILLDQPLDGVDPICRRKIWKILIAYKDKCKTPFLLSTQGVRECEDLCDELVIIDKGKILANGSFADVRKKFPQNFKVQIFTKTHNSPKKKLLDEEMEKVLKARCDKDYTRLLIYDVAEGISMSDIYIEMEKVKVDFKDFIDYYTITKEILEEMRPEEQQIPTYESFNNMNLLV